MLKTRITELARNTFFVVCGAFLCAFLLVPGFSSFLLDLLFTAPFADFSALKKLLASSILMAFSFSASGFLTGLFIGYFSRNKGVVLSLFTSVIVAVYYSIKITSVLLRVEISGKLLYLRMLELGIHMLFLIGFAVVGAWMISRGRRKAELSSGNPAGEAESSE